MAAKRVTAALPPTGAVRQAIGDGIRLPERWCCALLAAALLMLWTAAPLHGAVAFEDCRLEAGPGQPTVGARCTMIDVPLDHARPDGEQLSLFVAVVPALTPTPRPDALAVVAGGPGHASSEFFASISTAFGRIQRQRDLLVIDQRGTGASLRLDCDMPEDALLLGEPDEAIRELIHACLDALPADPRHFTTSVAVRDMELVRERLGYPQLNLYGVSYGSRVAQHFARRFPEHTRSLILDGVLPADVALGPDIAPLAQQALDRAFERCAQDQSCARRFPDLGRQLQSLLVALDRESVEVSISDPLTGRPMLRRLGGQELRATLRLMSYATETVALLPLLISEAADGHLAPLGAQAQLLLTELQRMLAIGMHHAVVCTEDLPFVVLDGELLHVLRQTYLGAEQVVTLQQICDLWPQGVLDENLHEPLVTDIPVLILSGEHDPITPPAYGDRVLSHLGRATHVVAPGQGHGLAPRGCVPRLMDRFVRDLDPVALDAACVQAMGPAPFFLDFTGPAP